MRIEIREGAFLGIVRDLGQGRIWKSVVMTLAETPAGTIESEVAPPVARQDSNGWKRTSTHSQNLQPKICSDYKMLKDQDGAEMERRAKQYLHPSFVTPLMILYSAHRQDPSITVF